MQDNKFKQIFPFESPRRLQRKLIEKVTEYFDEGYRHIVINAPTGIGKSIVGMAVANYFLDVNDNTAVDSSYILTSQKILQDQYVDDFHIPTVKGRDNYPCTFKKGYTAKGAPCVTGKWRKDKRAKTCPDCPYYTARSKTYNDPISILNYTYFLNMGLQEPQEIQFKRKLLILDECHSVESKLLDFASVIIDRKQCKFFDLYDAILDFPQVSDSEEAKFYWLFKQVLPQLVDEYKRVSVVLESLTEMDSEFKKMFSKVEHLKDIVCKIENVKEEYEDGKPCAILQDGNKTIKFKPIFGKSLAAKYLLPFGSKTLSMSATVLSKEQYCRDMGFNKEETMFIKLPSLFPIENRKVYALNIGSMAYKEKAKTIPKIAETVKLLLDKHKGERGIIHTVNYEVAEYLIKYLKSDRLIMPKGKNRDSEIEYFMNSSKNDLVLISPSLQEGVDLKDDLSRFTIVCKMPYASLADDWVKKRMELSPKWYSEQTLMNLIQMTGRSVRTETDFATAYILDSNFNWFFNKNKNKFLKWWSESVIIK